MLFGHWLEQRDIPDPYRKSEEAFASVFKLIEQSALLWAEKLKSLEIQEIMHDFNIQKRSNQKQ
ncbi:protein tyrosine phosphatase [Klebsiella pneumoniae]|uniref:Protein tyrosine phosphatase n=1 Tax=Klebsiella pneumoniae TaxID=573 RepID=A0A447RKY6_KLEPN|nr:protein tyrosine phosphatase [Klebsiella pneumoniae]